MDLHRAGRQLGVALPAHAARAMTLALHRLCDARCDLRAALRRRRLQVRRARRRHRHAHVDPVEQRPAEPAPVAVHVGRRAQADRGVPAQVAARAGVGGADELEAGRVAHRVAGPDHGHFVGLQRLAERLQQRRAELRRLVQEQDPAVGQRRFPRALHAAAADQPFQRRAVVRRAERRPRDQRRARAQGTGHRMHARHLQRLPAGQRRQDARQAPGRHGLATARRAEQQRVVAAGRGDLQRPLQPILAA